MRFRRVWCRIVSKLLAVGEGSPLEDSGDPVLTTCAVDRLEVYTGESENVILARPLGWYAVIRSASRPVVPCLGIHGCEWNELRELVGGEWFGSGAFCKRFDSLSAARAYFLEKIHSTPVVFLHPSYQVGQ